MRILFTAAITLAAAMLFFVQPMMGKALLPLLGGAPQVWIACMLFFQAALLAGYAYAHAAAERLDVRRHAPLHLALALAPLVAAPSGPLGAPFSLPLDRAAAAGHPTLAVLWILAVTAGLPFFVVGATSPLLQRWFAGTDHPDARDPYFLYSASNLGSLVALLGYPLILEPRLGLAAQARGWAWGYALLVALLAACGVAAARRRAAAPAASEPSGPPSPDVPHTSHAPLLPARRLRWIALAFVPSSHLLGVTAYITADVAPVPLLWIAPLALYLVSFILVFARRPLIPRSWMVRLLALGAAMSILTLLAEATSPAALLIPMHLATFFFGAMVCHGELARDRPDRRHLTAFYLHLSIGGALGGLFNALIAPLLFRGLVEYPLAIILACLCRPAPEPAPDAPAPPSLLLRWRPDLLHAARIAALTVALILGWRLLGRAHDRLAVGVLFCFPLLLVYHTLTKPRRFALSLGAIALASALHPGAHGDELHRERTFFGVVRVTRDSRGFLRLVHGSTVHGIQSPDPARRREPLAYFTRSGPIGRAFARVDRLAEPGAAVGVIGLGAGALAAYAVPGQRWTFYEIDPAVARVARGGGHFTYLDDAFPGGAGLRIVIGDARLAIRDAPDAHFDLLVLDAFSSDVIPMHLLTREALALYQAKLAPRGILAFHVSSRYLDLFAVLGALARDAGLVGVTFQDMPSPDEEQAGKAASQWAMVARRAEDLEELTADPDAAPLRARPGVDAWTDDVSDIVGIMRR